MTTFHSSDKYVIMDEDTTIGCPRHGDFLCTPDEHLKGYGCPECRLEDIKVKIKEVVDRLDYCIEHEHNASENGFSVKPDSYSNELHNTFGKLKRIVDEIVEIRGKNG